MSEIFEQLVSELPEDLRGFADLSNPREQRLMAAQGVIPIPPKDLVKVLHCLAFDSDEEIKNEAKKSVLDIPENTINDILSDGSTSPNFLDYIARNIENEQFAQKVLLNPNTLDSTFAHLAVSQHSASNLEIIANNGQRILRSIEIVESLSNNPAVSRSTLDGVISFISLYLEKDERIKKYFESTDEKEKEEQELAKKHESDIEEIEETFFDDLEISEDLLEEFEGDDSIPDSVRESISLKLQNMTMAEKLKVAISGNMEARRILIRDNNRVVSSSVLRNPRLTDMEVILISQSKVVDEEILRKVSETRRWVRHYQVKNSLINNPKTPAHISMNLLRHLRERDLKALASNRNIPGVVIKASKNMLKQKK